MIMKGNELGNMHSVFVWCLQVFLILHSRWTALCGEVKEEMSPINAGHLVSFLEYYTSRSTIIHE